VEGKEEKETKKGKEDEGQGKEHGVERKKRRREEEEVGCGL
jgi:hypothetical protein